MIEQKLLIKARKDAGMNRSDLARAAKMQPSVITWIETGRFYPYESQMEKIAAALGWEGDPTELFREVTEDAAS